MVSEIRIYVEGGGKGKDRRADMREGFSKFLTDVVEAARSRKVRFSIVASGPRRQAYEDFRRALKDHSQAFNVLLVDSEGPVSYPNEPRAHLRQFDRWDLSMCAEENCHLMIQMMEAWFLADVEALAKFYGTEFNSNSIPGHAYVEQIPKDDVIKALEKATRGVSNKLGKGPYHKGRHSAELLQRIGPAKVCEAAAGCRRLFTMLDQKVGANIPWLR